MSHAPSLRDTLILVTRDGMGHAEPDLAWKVLGKWLELAEANGTLPGAIAFYTRGVLATCEGSPVLDRLRAFEAAGVRLIVCKTCVDHLGVTDRVRVGVIGGMGDILVAQTLAAKVITL